MLAELSKRISDINNPHPLNAINGRFGRMGAALNTIATGIQIGAAGGLLVPVAGAAGALAAPIIAYVGANPATITLAGGATYVVNRAGSGLSGSVSVNQAAAAIPRAFSNASAAISGAGQSAFYWASNTLAGMQSLPNFGRMGLDIANTTHTLNAAALMPSGSTTVPGSFGATVAVITKIVGPPPVTGNPRPNP